MQTYTIKENQQELIKFITQQQNEPIVLKVESGESYLVMPFSPDKWQQMFELFYQSINQIQNMQENTAPKKTGKMFTDKWTGFMKGAEIDNSYKEEYYEYIKQKHQ